MCDLLCALGPATEGGVTLFAKNSDRPPAEAQALEWNPPRREAVTRTTYLELPGPASPTLGFLGFRPTWMWGVEQGVNEAGVAAGNATIYTTLDPRPFPDALTGMDLVRLALERATSAADAVEVVTDLLERHGQGGSGHAGERRPYWSSFLLADPGRAFVVETSGTTWGAEEVGTVRAISNRTTIAAFDAEHRHPRQPVEVLVDPRLDAGRGCLAAPPVSAAGLRRHLGSHVGGDDGWTVCMHVDGVEATTASMVVRLPESSAGPPVAWCLLGSPCTSVYVPMVVGHPLGPVPAWERFAALAQAARSRLDALEAELDAGVGGAASARADWNASAWARVADVLDTVDTVAAGGIRAGRVRY